MLAWADRGHYADPAPGARAPADRGAARGREGSIARTSRRPRSPFATTRARRWRSRRAATARCSRIPYTGGRRRARRRRPALVLRRGDGLAPVVQRERRESRGRARGHRREQSRIPVSRAERHLSVAAANLEMGRVQDADALQREGELEQGARLQLAPRVRNLVRDSARGGRRDRHGVLVSVGQQPRLSQRRRGAARARRAARRPAARRRAGARRRRRESRRRLGQRGRQRCPTTSCSSAPRRRPASGARSR